MVGLEGGAQSEECGHEGRTGIRLLVREHHARQSVEDGVAVARVGAGQVRAVSLPNGPHPLKSSAAHDHAVVHVCGLRGGCDGRRRRNGGDGRERGRGSDRRRRDR